MPSKLIFPHKPQPASQKASFPGRQEPADRWQNLITLHRLCGTYNPAFKVFALLCLVRVAAAVGYCGRNLGGSHRSELEGINLFGISAPNLTLLLAAIYFVWVVYSMAAILSPMLRSSAAFCKLLLNHMPLSSTRRALVVTYVDLTFYACFYLTTFDVESDLFALLLVPVLLSLALCEDQRRVYPERFAQEALGHNSKAVHRSYAKRAKVKLPSLEEYENKAASLAAATKQYPERFAQEALGHNSKAVHRAYARRAQVKLPSLESYERQAADGRIIQIPQFSPAMHQIGQKVG